MAVGRKRLLLAGARAAAEEEEEESVVGPAYPLLGEVVVEEEAEEVV